jgi:outer membrane protein
MKKSIAILLLAAAVISCNKETTTKEAKGLKTACVDSEKLMKDYTEAKDLTAKFKSKSEVEGKKLDEAQASFDSDVAYYKKNAKANGEEWAQQKGGELQQRQQQIQYYAQQIDAKLRQEQGAEMDTLVKSIKRFITDYGKKNAYDYIYVSGDGGALLYGKEQYDITKDIVKLLNEKYEAGDKKAAAAEKKPEVKK